MYLNLWSFTIEILFLRPFNFYSATYGTISMMPIILLESSETCFHPVSYSSDFRLGLIGFWVHVGQN